MIPPCASQVLVSSARRALVSITTRAPPRAAASAAGAAGQAAADDEDVDFVSSSWMTRPRVVQVERDVHRRRGVGERADGDGVHARLGVRPDVLQRDAARRLRSSTARRRGRARTIADGRAPSWAGVMLSSSTARAPASSASASCSSESTSTWTTTSPVRRASTARSAAATPPAAATWLSLIRTASYSPMRWLRPPPTRTAYFSKSRRPGVVLRVSDTEAPRAGDRVDVAARHRRDARQPLQQVQREPLAGEDRRRGSGRAA